TYFAQLNDIERDQACARAAELIEWPGIAEFADLRCGALLTGQKQRVNIARALVADPPVLIMDEPTLGLDVLSNRIILKYIRRERDAGKTIVLSTHYLDEAETLCDEIGLLHDGRLVAEGDLQSLRELSGEERLSDIFLKIIHADEVVEAAIH
ncbi:MAG: ATP-binding cassette domain-containing protein, partial [Planctomycetes bacterium]|nr:ATP-binding cassette domain-containing protein [Planctomycetota bacterium]